MSPRTSLKDRPGPPRRLPSAAGPNPAWLDARLDMVWLADAISQILWLSNLRRRDDGSIHEHSHEVATSIEPVAVNDRRQRDDMKPLVTARTGKNESACHRNSDRA